MLKNIINIVRHKLYIVHLMTISIIILLSLLVTSLILIILNISPIQALSLMFYGGIGSIPNFLESLVSATPLIIVSLGLAISFTAGIWNIGAEGQIYMGGLVSAVTALYLRTLSPIIVIPLSIIAGSIAGLAWALIPAILKVYNNVNEVFTTLFMNYIALYLVSYLLLGPLRDPISGYPQTEILPEALRLPILLPGTRFHLGIIFAVFIITPLCYIFLNRVSTGLQLKLLGGSEEFATYAGVDKNRLIIIALLMSGFLSGLAGAIEILGVQYTMRITLSPGWGYTGIAVALLGYLHPLGILLASIFFGIIYNGSFSFAALTATPIGLANIIQSLILIFTLTGYLIEKRILWRWYKHV